MTAARTGRAFIVSAMTAMAGVAVIVVLVAAAAANFGLFVALKIADRAARRRSWSCRR